jgi:hypothetical protein
MSIFVPATEHDIHMYANFGCLDVYRCFAHNFLSFAFLEFYIMQ